MIGVHKLFILKMLFKQDCSYNELNVTDYPAPSIRRVMNTMKGLYINKTSRNKFSIIKVKGIVKCYHCNKFNLIGSVLAKELICIDCYESTINPYYIEL